MVECPKCHKLIGSLDRLETREYEDEATYDSEAEQLEYEPKGEWTGNGYGEVIKTVFCCPECDEVLFDNEEDAKNFLAEDHPQWVSGQQVESV